MQLLLLAEHKTCYYYLQQRKQMPVDVLSSSHQLATDFDVAVETVDNTSAAAVVAWAADDVERNVAVQSDAVAVDRRPGEQELELDDPNHNFERSHYFAQFDIDL